jgi:hypothetical protein
VLFAAAAAWLIATLFLAPGGFAARPLALRFAARDPLVFGGLQ